MKTTEPQVSITNPRKTGLPQLYFATLVQMPFSRRLFSYTSNIVICSTDEVSVVSQMRSNAVFSAEKSGEGDNATVVFEVEESIVQNTNPEGQKMADMGKMFAIPTNRLVLRLDSKGIIKDVLNRNEIYSKWEELYKTLSEGMSDELKRQIEDSGDSEFSNPLKGVQTSFLHSIFFNPIYQYEISTYKKHTFNVSNNLKLIQGENVDLGMTGEVQKIDKETLIIHYSSYLCDDPSLLKAARKLYQNAVPEDSGVKADLDVDYVYDIWSGTPIYISASYVETIEGTIKYKQQSEIKILA